MFAQSMALYVVETVKEEWAKGDNWAKGAVLMLCAIAVISYPAMWILNYLASGR